MVIVSEKQAERGAPPQVGEVQAALSGVVGVSKVAELPNDERAHAFELSADKDTDLRPELFRLAVQKGWMLLELRRDAQTLEDVFRDLTKGDEQSSRQIGSSQDSQKKPAASQNAAPSGG